MLHQVQPLQDSTEHLTNAGGCERGWLREPGLGVLAKGLNALNDKHERMLSLREGSQSLPVRTAGF